MEIHPPHGAIRSWRDFLLQLGTITAGVLIALSFEGIREAIHDRSLVREARENIRREIADNRREIRRLIASCGDFFDGRSCRRGRRTRSLVDPLASHVIS